MSEQPIYKISFLLDYFNRQNPHPASELKYNSVFQLLVAVMLSAQCTDKRVNMITPDLFQKYPDPQTMSEAEFSDVFYIIRSCTYPNNKAKHIIDASKMIVENYDGEVPDNRDDLQSLPGVGRKTANVVLSVAFRKPFFAVDTHVFRVADRLGLTHAKNVRDSEIQLTKIFPDENIPDAHHWLLLHGRYICKARTPDCHSCKLTPVCDYFTCNSERS